jgi:protein-disulfide isomerase
MPSAKQSRRRRQAARTPPPPVRSTARRRQASPRVLLGAGAAVVLIVVGVVLAVVLGGGGSSSKSDVPARGSLVNALPGAAEVQQLFKGIPQHGNVLGSPSAPVTLVEYIDLQCPYCQQFESDAMPTLIRRFVRPGKVKVEARPIAFIGPDSERGRAALLAAGQQNRLFNFAQLMYVNQRAENTGWLNDEIIRAAAASIPGLDVPRLLDERGSGAMAERARAMDELATAFDVRATPTIFVGKSGERPRRVELSSPSDVQSIARAIDAAAR